MNFVSDEDFSAGALPASVAASRQHESTSRINMQCRYDARPRGSWHDEERHFGVLVGWSMLQVIQTNDIVGSTVELLVVMINVIETQVTYQTRWRPFGIALRALTGPLLLGNLKVLSGALSP
jgi:hypothetical protein